MTRTKGALRWGGVFSGASAALYFLALVVSGFGADAVALLPAGVLFAVCAAGLLQGRRWVAYIAFIAGFIGLSFAISNIWTTGAVPGWLYLALAVTHALTIIFLFAGLWKTPQVAMD